MAAPHPTPAPRRLSIPDAAAYRALMLEAYARHPEAFTSTAEERRSLPLSWWASRLNPSADAAALVFGAWLPAAAGAGAGADEQSPRLVGAAGLQFEFRARTRHRVTLMGMYVAPEARGQGLGDALVATALAHARSRPGVRVVQLTVSESNTAARALYERQGFTVFGREPLAVAHDGGYLVKLHLQCDLGEPDISLAPGAAPSPRTSVPGVPASDPAVVLHPLNSDELLDIAGGRAPRNLAGLVEPGALPPPFVASRALQLLQDGAPARWSRPFLIRRAHDGLVLGNAGFKRLPQAGEVDIGYGLAPGARGHGHATAAVRALLALAFAPGGVQTVLAEVLPGNQASIGVVRRCGFAAGPTRTDEDGERVVQWRVHAPVTPS